MIFGNRSDGQIGNLKLLLLMKFGGYEMDDGPPISDEKQQRVIAQIVELQREFYFENKNKETERRRRLRDIIDRAIPQGED